MRIPLCVFICAVLSGTMLAVDPPAAPSNPSPDLRKPGLTIPGHDVSGSGVIAYNPNGHVLAVSAGEKVIRIYDTRSGDPLKAELSKTLSGHAAQILGLAFSDANTLVSISLDQTVKIWDVESGKLLHSSDLALGKQIRFAIAPGSSSLAADSSFGKARLWNYRTGELLKTFEPNDSWVSALAFTPDGKLLVIGTDKGVVRVMDVATWRVTRTIDLDSPVHSLAASAERIVVGYGDGTVAMLSFGEQASVPEMRKQSGAIDGLAFSPKGDQFASASADRTVKVWDAGTFKVLCSMEGHPSSVLSVVFSPGGKNVVSIDADGNVNLWSVP